MFRRQMSNHFVSEFLPRSGKPFAKVAMAILATAALSACGNQAGPETSPEGMATDTKNAEATSMSAEGQSEASPMETGGDPLEQAINGAHRSEANRARDVFRHPAETLEFFAVSPDQTVVEVFPGGGWYTEILAPLIASGSGQYIAAHADPGDSARRRERISNFETRFSGDPVYGDVDVMTLGTAVPDAYTGVADTVLTFRNVHNWIAAEREAAMFAMFYEILQPGGTLGVVEHRADPGTPDAMARNSGYVKESRVRALATNAGFEFVEASEVNANPADTKDHPFGVWTLPPSRRTSATREPNPDFDRTSYDAIGESDRMTLKFRKPQSGE